MVNKEQISNSHHSTQLHEVINKPPSWLLRSGISFVFFVTLVLLGLTYFIQVPEKVKTSVRFKHLKVLNVPSSKEEVYAEINFSKEPLPKFKIGQRLGINLNAYAKKNEIKLSGTIETISNGKENNNLFIVKLLIDKAPINFYPKPFYPANADIIINNESLLERIWKNILKSKKI